jgi:hypothetical protein
MVTLILTGAFFPSSAGRGGERKNAKKPFGTDKKALSDIRRNVSCHRLAWYHTSVVKQYCHHFLVL